MRITVTNDGNNVTPYSGAGWVTNYFYNDGEFTLIRPGGGSMGDHIRTLHICAYSDQYINRKLDVLICGEIGLGSAMALEEMGVTIYRNVTGSRDAALEAFAKGTLDKGANVKRSDVENFLDYSITIWNKDGIYEKAYDMFSSSLTDEDKRWLFDKWFDYASDWRIIDKYLTLIDVPLELSAAIRYMNGFLLEHPYAGPNSRREDEISYQDKMVQRLKLIKSHLDPESAKIFLDESLIVAAKYRWIVVAEYLMDEGADIDYKNKKESVSKYESKMKDLTMAEYLAYYRKYGKKKGSAREYFQVDEKRYNGLIYAPEMVAPKKKASSKDVFGKAAEKKCKELLKDYGEPDLLKETTSSAALSRFIDQYNWDDGLELPHFIAHHPKCSKALKKRMFDLAEGSMYKTKDFEASTDEPWKQFLTEVYGMLHNR